MPETAITAIESRALFAPFARESVLILAVSGGPDSTALLWLAARWRKIRRKGPRLVVVTVDHGLRKESAAEARAVKQFAAQFDLAHVAKRWQGDKPKTGLPAAARAARYRLLTDAARHLGASHILTAHTLDDQAETVLMRMAKGSGVSGLRAMAPTMPLGAVQLSRPLLGVAKARLVATLDAAKIPFAVDPTNADPAYLRPRLRALLPQLAAEGLDAAGFARLAGRLARVDAAIERMTDGAERYLQRLSGRDPGYDAAAFAALPDEIRIRLLQRAIGRAGHEGVASLGKIEALAVALAEADTASRFRRTLAGAVVTRHGDRLTIAGAPPRRGMRRSVSAAEKPAPRRESSF